MWIRHFPILKLSKPFLAPISTSCPLKRPHFLPTRGKFHFLSSSKMPSRYAEAHLNATGAGDARPTALDIIKDEGLEGKLTGKVFFTGCASGIGIETARALSATGASLYLTARNTEKGRSALADILEPGRVELTEMDQNSLDGVRACAKKFLQKSKTLNCLINNAGIM
jgi:hypothetical protein